MDLILIRNNSRLLLTLIHHHFRWIIHKRLVCCRGWCTSCVYGEVRLLIVASHQIELIDLRF